MKASVWMAMLATAAIIAGPPLTAQQTAPGAAAQAARPAPLRSPEIHPDRTVTFRLLAPKASEVTVNGSWDNGTDIKMTRDDAGVWSASVWCVQSAAHVWRGGASFRRGRPLREEV